MTNRLLRPLAVALVSGLVVAGCSSQASESNSFPSSTAAQTSQGTEAPSVPDVGPIADDVGDVEVVQAFGEAPTFTFKGKTPPAGLAVEVLSEGDGPKVEPNSTVVADYAGIVWGKDKTFDDSFSRGAPSMFGLSGVVRGWSAGIPNHAVGSRLLISIPPELGYGPDGNPQAGIGGADTIVFIVDVVEAFGPEHTGDADATVRNRDADLPVTVEGTPGEPATVTINEGAPEPAEQRVVLLAEGEGEKVAVGESVALAYSGTTWDGGPAGSSWSVGEVAGTGPVAGPVGNGAIIDAAIGVPVGSRILVLAPKSQQGPASAYIFDILGKA